MPCRRRPRIAVLAGRCSMTQSKASFLCDFMHIEVVPRIPAQTNANSHVRMKMSHTFSQALTHALITYTRKHVRMHARARAHTHTKCTHTHTHIWCVCVCVCVCVCL